MNLTELEAFLLLLEDRLVKVEEALLKKPKAPTRQRRVGTVTCPFGTAHAADERICECGYGHKEYVITVDGETTPWNGGFWDLKHDIALQPDASLHPETSHVSSQWALTQEEMLLVDQWRTFREEVLESYGDDKPYRYEILVKMGDLTHEILSRTQGLVEPSDPHKTKKKAN